MRNLKYYSDSGKEIFYGTEESAGLDLPYYDPDTESVTIEPGETVTLPTGVHLEIPRGNFGLLDTRSSSGKLGVDLMCRTIDSDYRGNIKIMAMNHSKKPVVVKRGDYLAQIIIIPINPFAPIRVSSADDLSATERGEGGFGSTGNGLKEGN